MTIKKDVYEMCDGIPIWKHLKDNGEFHSARMQGTDFGTLAELIGTREIKKSIDNGLLNKLFPDIDIMSVNRIRRNKSSKYGDYNLQINYKKDNTYSKKILIVEIKHGLIEISQQQIKRYSKYLLFPSEYFRKADEVKVIFMLFNRIDSANSSSTYMLCEFNKDLANKIINAMPKVNETDNNIDIFEVFNKIQGNDRDIIEEHSRCKHSWEDCNNSYSSACNYCIRNDLCEEKKGDYYIFLMNEK